MGKRQTFCTDKAPSPKGPYSQAIICGGVLYVSGQGPFDPATGNIVRGTTEEEARLALNNLKAVVEGAGFKMEDVVKVTCFLAEIGEFEKFNKIYAEFFRKDPPARSALQAARLPADMKVEIDAIAVKPR